MSPVPIQIDKEIEERRCVGQAGGDGCACDFIARRKDDEHKERIQDNVEDTSHGHSESGFLCRADRPDQMTAQDIADGRDRSCDHGPEHVVINIRAGSLISADDRDQPASEDCDQQSEQDSGGDPPIETEGKGFSRVADIHASESAGNDACTADAEQIRDGSHQYKDRHGDGEGCDHGGAPGPADIPCVRKIIDNIDELGDDRGDCQCHDRHRDRGGFKDCHTAVIFPAVIFIGH